MLIKNRPHIIICVCNLIIFDILNTLCKDNYIVKGTYSKIID